MLRAPHQSLCLIGLVALCLVSFHLATAEADSLDTSLDTNEPHLPHFHPKGHQHGGEKDHQHSSPKGSKGGHHPGSKLGKHKKRHRRHKFDHHARAHLFDDKHRGHLITGPFGSGPKKRGIQRDKEGHIKLLYCVEGMALTHEEGGPHPMAAAKEPSVLCPWVDGVCCGDGHSCCPFQFACLATGGCRHSDKPLPNIPGYRPHPPTKAEIAAEMARQGHPLPVGPGKMAAPTSPIPGRMAYPPFPMFGPYPPPPPPQIVQPPVPKITIISNDNGLWAPKNGQQKSN